MFAYKPSFLPARIIIFGAGGTGSRLISPLSQLVRTSIKKHNPQAWLMGLPIYVVDGDIVEQKNLTRQNFIAPDVGRNKALVVAERYSAAFDVDIYPVQKYLGERPAGSTDPHEVFGAEYQSVPTLNGGNAEFNRLFGRAIIIIAVDSADARRLILKQVLEGLTEENPQSFVIDAGNEDDFGQVRWFTTDFISSRYAGSSLRPGSKFALTETVEVDKIPMDLAYYQNLGSSAQELSCADLPQTLAINTMMATLILTITQNFLYMKPMTYDGVRYSMQGGMAVESNTLQSWRRRIPTVDAVTGLTYGNGWPSMGSSRMKSHYENKSGAASQQFWGVVSPVITKSLEFYRKNGMIVQPDGSWLPTPPPPPAPAAIPAPVAMAPAESPPPRKRFLIKKDAPAQEVEVDTSVPAEEAQAMPSLRAVPPRRRPVEGMPPLPSTPARGTAGRVQARPVVEVAETVSDRDEEEEAEHSNPF